MRKYFNKITKNEKFIKSTFIFLNVCFIFLIIAYAVSAINVFKLPFKAQTNLSSTI